MWPSKAAALLAVLMPAAAAAVECAPGSLVVDTGAETLGFRVEVADSPEERAQGLMFRKELPAGTGMLFIYESPQPVSFWMRNTLIPLDMVFADETGVIRHIHRNARPLDETPIPGAAVGDPDPDRLFVLEIAGGEADRLGLQPGQPMAHPGMGDNAVLACD